MNTSTAAAVLLTDVRQGVASWTLNRPQKRNALSLELLEALRTAQEAVARDRAVQVIVLGGAGPVFCAGHDLAEMVDQSEEEYRRLFRLCSDVMLGLRQLPQPVIARVHSTATAAGCQLVAACDLAVAADTATFATPGVKIGLFCTTPMVPLVRAIPDKAALEMLLTGRPVSAQQALAWGLLNRVVPAERLDEAIAELVSAIQEASPEVVRLGKAAFYNQRHLDENTAYERATEVMTHNALAPDAQEGIEAFLQKRRPRWPGS